MKNEVVKKDIVFTPQEVMAENLNKEEFTEDMISNEYYFKTYGLKTLELKEKIEKGIKNKFNQKSDILESFGWSEEELNDPKSNVDKYLFYVMLYREFEYPKVFDKLEPGMFAGKYNNIQYFGIDSNTDDSVREQIRILYYNSEDDFAITIDTKSNDEVIFYKNPQGYTFKEMYENMNLNAEEYNGSVFFKDMDEFKAPNISFNVTKEYQELQDKYFETIDSSAVIQKAIQTIQFSLDEKGGKIKSEAAIQMETMSAVIEEDKPKKLYVDDTFALFIREKGKELQYFAARIEDITKFQ